MSQRANIYFYNGDGASQLDNLWDIFSGTSIARGTTSPVQKFRIYNNYSGASDIADANDIKIYVSGDTEFLTDSVKKQSVFDYTKELISDGHIEIRCTLSSETGLVPPSGSTFVPLIYGTAFYGNGFDTISASGSYNYNEYEMRLSIPLTWTSGGAVYPSFFVDYTNDGFAVDG